jgi:hypothetical protein
MGWSSYVSAESASMPTDRLLFIDTNIFQNIERLLLFVEWRRCCEGTSSVPLNCNVHKLGPIFAFARKRTAENVRDPRRSRTRTRRKGDRSHTGRASAIRLRDRACFAPNRSDQSPASAPPCSDLRKLPGRRPCVCLAQFEALHTRRIFAQQMPEVRCVVVAGSGCEDRSTPPVHSRRSSNGSVRVGKHRTCWHGSNQQESIDICVVINITADGSVELDR